MKKFSEIRHVHFIGVGGIGVSALAHYYAKHGKEISGSDLHIVPTLLPEQGTYWEGHQPERIPSNTDFVVHSPAVPESDPELTHARSLGIETHSYPEALGEVARRYPHSVAVTGTHGKSTTTALIGQLFEAQGLDPTVVVGAVVPVWHRNFRNGSSDTLVVEACEYRAHMLSIPARTIVLTNLEHDHPDFYKDIAHTQQVFREYVKAQQNDGYLVVNGDDIHISAILDSANASVVRYGMSNAILDMRGSIIEKNELMQTIRLVWKGELLGEITTLLPGTYNAMNILAAMTTFMLHGGTVEAAQSVLDTFTGVGRRFEVVGSMGDNIVISDYAHHPTALAAVVEAARVRYPNRHLLVAFRPHHQERTKVLYKDFLKVLASISDLLLLEIYDVAGRESEHAISSKILLDDMPHADSSLVRAFCSGLPEASEYIRSRKLTGAVILVVGAGDADELAHALVEA